MDDRKPDMVRPDGTDQRDLARRIRAHSLTMVTAARASHVGSCLSAADILAVLYLGVLNIDPNSPASPDRDRFVMSKGHAAAALYAVLAERGFFPISILGTYCEDGSPLVGHVTTTVPGVEHSTGSLGHGLPVAVGMALAGSRSMSDYRVVALLSDGECDEGSVWEAALFAGHHRLSNLTVVIDCNGIQSLDLVRNVIDLEPLAAKWRSFGWDVIDLDGHDVTALTSALTADRTTKPLCVIARTTKGRGVSFMEDELVWHYRPPSRDQLAAALRELAAQR